LGKRSVELFDIHNFLHLVVHSNEVDLLIVVGDNKNLRVLSSQIAHLKELVSVRLIVFL